MGTEEKFNDGGLVPTFSGVSHTMQSAFSAPLPCFDKASQLREQQHFVLFSSPFRAATVVTTQTP